MKYSIITPTRNEGKYIEQTIRSVIAQSVLPEEWLIMDDESNDNTESLIQPYLKDHSFIRYIRLNNFRNELKNRGGRVAAIINYADTLRIKTCDIIAKIDGDISFDRDFFSNMLQEFECDSSLAIASGHMVENGIAEEISDRKSGRGASLIIRYDCYTQIGKFIESKTRGEDDMAYVSARALGYRTQTFDYYFNHLKPIGARNSALKNHFETGYYKGTIPYWFPFFLATLLRDVFKKPYFIGAIVILYGYFLSYIIERYRPFPAFATKQLQKEQIEDLRKKLFG